MRLSSGSVAALAAALFVGFALWPENNAVQGPSPLFAQNKSKPRLFPKKHPEKSAPTKRPSEHVRAAPKTAMSPSVTTGPPLSSDAPLESKTEARISEALDQAVDFTIDAEPLRDALDFIATRYQIPIILDAKTLEDASIDTTTEVKMPVSNIKLRQMLTLLLQQLPQPLGFDIQDGVLMISTVEKIHEHSFVVIYDCRDLINLRSIYPANSVRQRAADPGKKGMGGGLFQAASTPAAKPKGVDIGESNKPSDKGTEPAKASCSEPEIPLIRVIQYAGDPDDWKDEEGGGPKITEIGGLIVVKQNPIVHEQIKRILADLRRMKKEGAFGTSENNHTSPPAAGTPKAPVQFDDQRS